MADGARRHQAGLPNPVSGKDWLERAQDWDPVGLVLVTHAAVVIALGHVVEPVWAAALSGVLMVWRLSTGIMARRADEYSAISWILRKEGGSLILAAGVIAADAGTESPFFFWPLILLASQALQLSMRQLAAMVGIAIATYLAVVFMLTEFTAASFGRLGLLLAFSAVMMLGRVRLESAQRQADRSEQLLEDAFSAAPVGLMVSPVSAEPVYMNEAARRMGLGRAFESFEEGKPLRQMVISAWENRQTTGPELFTFRREFGDTRYLRVIATPHGRDVDEAVVVCAEDVTAQVTAGEEQRSFMRFAGHQLRTPLTPIIAYAELLETGQVDPSELGSIATEIGTSARHLQRLFDRMLSVVSLRDSSPQQLTFERASKIISHIDSAVLQDVVVNGEPSTLLWCDPTLVAMALHELLDNGQRHGRAPIEMDWTRQNGSIEFRVWDAGPGPDPEISEEALLADWGQLDTPKMMTPDMGSHLGLAHARILAGLSGGELKLHRNEDEWAFVLSLPASPLSKAASPTGPVRRTQSLEEV